jgi:diguanylate cyclase (GGDEF)-like protein
MTDIYNGAHFYRELRSVLKQKKTVSVLILDIDHFKRINDGYGHPVGDAVIKGVVKIIKKTIRKSDLVARIGGEEFAILLTDTNEYIALVIAEKIRFAVENETANTALYCFPEAMTISVGVFTNVNSTYSPDECIHFADIALYEEKNTGRNKVEFYREEMGG